MPRACCLCVSQRHGTHTIPKVPEARFSPIPPQLSLTGTAAFTPSYTKHSVPLLGSRRRARGVAAVSCCPSGLPTPHSWSGIDQRHRKHIYLLWRPVFLQQLELSSVTPVVNPGRCFPSNLCLSLLFLLLLRDRHEKPSQAGGNSLSCTLTGCNSRNTVRICLCEAAEITQIARAHIVMCHLSALAPLFHGGQLRSGVSHHGLQDLSHSLCCSFLARSYPPRFFHLEILVQAGHFPVSFYGHC